MFSVSVEHAVSEDNSPKETLVGTVVEANLPQQVQQKDSKSKKKQTAKGKAKQAKSAAATSSQSTPTSSSAAPSRQNEHQPTPPNVEIPSPTPRAPLSRAETNQATKRSVIGLLTPTHQQQQQQHTDEGDSDGDNATTSEANTPTTKGSVDQTQTQTRLTKSVPFSTGNPNVETFKGVLHLFRNHTKPHRSNLVCILAVPSFMAISDLCNFLGAHLPHVMKIRILRHTLDNKGGYMAMLLFSDQQKADEFHDSYHNKPFTSMCSEVCKILYVAECRFESDVGPFDTNKQNPSDLTELPTCAVCLERLDPQSSGLLTIVCNHTFHCNCLTKWEDSSCPVCRYAQEPSQSLTCTHCNTTSDLWMCLICGDVGCGRYSQGHAVQHFRETNHTYAIDLSHQRVWDYVGDGWVHRLLQNTADGKLVAMDTPHHNRSHNSGASSSSRFRAGGCCAGEFDGESSRPRLPDNFGSDEDDNPGDHASTSYKHKHKHHTRKHVDGEDGDDGDEISSEMFDAIMESRLECITQEYTYLLTSQLEQQRNYYDDRHSRLEASLMSQMKRLEDELTHAQCQVAELKTQLAEVERDKAQLDRKTSAQTAYITKLKQDIDFLKTVNGSMVQNQDQWRKQIDDAKHKLDDKTKDNRIKELEEQVRDLMFALDTQERLAKSPLKKDIAEGVMLVTEGSAATKKKKQSRR